MSNKMPDGSPRSDTLHPEHVVVHGERVNDASGDAMRVGRTTNGMATAGKPKVIQPLVIHPSMNHVSDGKLMIGVSRQATSDAKDWRKDNPDAASPNPLDPEPSRKRLLDPPKASWDMRGASEELNSAPSHSTGKTLDPAHADRVFGEATLSGSRGFRPKVYRPRRNGPAKSEGAIMTANPFDKHRAPVSRHPSVTVRKARGVLDVSSGEIQKRFDIPQHAEVFGHGKTRAASGGVRPSVVQHANNQSVGTGGGKGRTLCPHPGDCGPNMDANKAFNERGGDDETNCPAQIVGSGIKLS